jgi:hypothetical protein
MGDSGAGSAGSADWVVRTQDRGEPVRAKPLWGEAQERERQERERIEWERVALLKRQVEDWEFAQRIRGLVAEARQKLEQRAGGDLSAWLDQAAMIAERIDPLAAPNVGKLGQWSG